jgi:23S rRNA pseudouridine1911/1915/1917 synthase
MTILYKKFTREFFEAAYLINEEQSGMRLDQFVQIYMSGFSREAIKEKIRDGHILIKGRPGKHRPNSKVYEKETVVLTIKKTTHEDEYWRGEKLEIDFDISMVYEDDNIFVISKPPYMSTHPTGKHLFNCATVVLEERTQRTVHSIHRLDRETSGILLLGKNPKAAQIHTQSFENELVKKCYFFIGQKSGELVSNNFKAEERLAPDSREGRNRVYINAFPKDSKEGKRAETKFKILYQEGPYVLGLAFPQTGRQHQIRVHAKTHGFPLIGDKLYLGSYEMFQRFKDLYADQSDFDLMQLSRHALHAMALNIPFEGTRKTFISSIPQDLKAWVIENLKVDLSQFEKNLFEEIKSYFNTLSK